MAENIWPAPLPAAAAVVAAAAPELAAPAAVEVAAAAAPVEITVAPALFVVRTPPPATTVEAEVEYLTIVETAATEVWTERETVLFPTPLIVDDNTSVEATTLVVVDERTMTGIAVEDTDTEVAATTVLLTTVAVAALTTVDKLCAEATAERAPRARTL